MASFLLLNFSILGNEITTPNIADALLLGNNQREKFVNYLKHVNHELLELLEKDIQKFEQYFVEQKFPLPRYKSASQRNTEEKFHLLMQQLMMELPIEPFLKAYPEMTHWISQLQLVINIRSDNKQYNLTLQKLIEDVVITTKYDLLIENGEKVVAVDWTIEDIALTEKLEDSWKIQLQLFLIAETLEIIPDNISIIHCFVNGDDYPSIYQYKYSQEKYDAFRNKLVTTLSKLTTITHSTNHSKLSLDNSMNEHELNLQKFLNSEMTPTEYLATIPEVKI